MTKHVLITGTTKGLGRHLARSFADREWQVTGVGRQPASEASLPAGVRYLRCDLSAGTEIDELATKLDDLPDLIVNNAAIHAPPGADGPNFDYVEQMMRVNAVAPFLLTRALLLQKAEERPCTVIMLNSEAAYHTAVGIGTYSASKAALLAFTRALADEFKGKNASIATVVLGPLANDDKRHRLQKLAAQKSMNEQEITAFFLKRWNPNMVVDQLIDFDKVLQSILFIESLGATANGMICRLDGAASGTLF
jgi:NAD(P)-dependent dehydrogenase (short-subunit alcohol dehydrogenase family)